MTRLNGYLDSFVDQAGFRQHGGIWSGISRGDMIIASSGLIAVSGGSDVQIQAFGGSGMIAYRFGPQEGWATKIASRFTGGSANDGFFPLAVSGIFGLNDAYKGGAEINVNGNNGDINIYSAFRKLQFVTGSRAPLRLSGILIAPVTTGSTNNEQGDINSCLHGMLKPVAKFTGAAANVNSYTDPVDADEMKARALGVGTLFFNTGSGIANIAIGSGIAQWNFTTYKSGSTYPLSLTKETFVRLPLSTETISDLNYTYVSGPTGVAIWSPGLYKCTYSCTFRRITPSATLREAAVRAVLLPQLVNVAIPGVSGTYTIPQSHAYCNMSSTNAPNGSLHNSFLFNADAGDFLALEGALVDITGADGLNLTTSGTLMIIEKIGPKRGNFS